MKIAAAQLIVRHNHRIPHRLRQAPSDNAWMQRQIIDHTPESLTLVDALQPDLPIIYANPAFEALTGYSITEIIGKNCRFLQGTDHDQQELATLRAALQAGEACVVTLRNYRKDGSLFWNELHITPIRDPHGQVTHFLGAQKDVTERKWAEVAVELSNQRYYQIFDRASAVKLIIDPGSGTIADANLAAAAFYGYPREQLQTMSIRDLNPYAETEVSTTLLAAERSEHGYFETRHRLASGEMRDVNVYATPVDTPEGRVLYLIVVDVTHKRQSELRYRALFRQSNDAVFIVDLNGQHLMVNQRAADMFGYTVEELSRATYRDVVYPQDYPDTLAFYQRLIDGEQITPYECTLRHKNGQPVTAEINIEVVRDTDGRPVHFQSILRDVSERKLLEAELNQRYQELDGFFSVALDLLCIADNNTGTFLKVNKSWEATLGYPLDEMLSHPFLDFVHPDDIQPTLDVVEYLRQQNDLLHFTNRYRRADGTYCYIEWRVHPVGDILYAAARDITERKRMEDDLRQSEAKYRLLAENTSDGLLVFDATLGQVTYASPAYDRQNGRQPGEFIGLDLSEAIGNLNPDDRVAVMTAFADAVRQQAETATYTYRIVLASGEYSWREDSARFNYTADGNLKTMYVISRDISERKQAQQREFDLALERERVHLLTTFVQDAAHEFRTPLSIISTGTYLMARSDDAQRRTLKAEQIHGEVGRITELVDMLLLMARLESTDLQRFAAVDVGSLIMAEAQRVALTGGQGPRLKLSLPDGLLTISGDAEHLAHAFYQVLDNAFRFTPAEGAITVSAQCVEGQIHIDISDTGIGISPEDLPHIFETFWRRDSAHTTPGLGLGLPIAHRIIGHHGGRICVTSALGQGTSVTITLPAAAER